MASASKRAKTTTTFTATATRAGPNISGALAVPRQHYIPFQTGPSLERVPEDVLHEILSHLPTLHACFTEFNLIRVLALRALAKTSRLMRSRCLGLAWRSVGLFRSSIPTREHVSWLFRSTGEATKHATRVLKACPHLFPLIQTVSVILMRYHAAEIVPEVATRLAALPNLTTIQIIHAPSQMTSEIKEGFRGKRFPSVRRISLPSLAHEVIKSCPNIERVTCTEGNGSTIIGCLVKGECEQVRALRGISAPLARLVNSLPNLRYISVPMGGDMGSLTSFPLLDTIEIVVPCESKQDLSLSEVAADIKEAGQILKENESEEEKRVILTSLKASWEAASFEFDVNEGYMIRQVIKV